MHIDDRIWVITSYFNPMGFKNRLNNYKIFRQHLGAKLVAVELSYNGDFELNQNDAEILIQIDEGDIMFQKERLLNLALEALPNDTVYVAWVDCDVCIGDDAWEKAITALGQYPLVHLFSELHDLPEGTLPSTEKEKNSLVTRSAGRSYAEGISASELCAPPYKRAIKGIASGIAWASHTAIMKKHKFYDVLIVGAGDRAMFNAALGQFEKFRDYAELDCNRWQHYLEWASAYYKEIRGEIGYVDTIVYHLWHGDSAHRQSWIRQHTLASYGFDPITDIVIGESGSWLWNSNKPEMHSYLCKYFAGRRDDG